MSLSHWLIVGVVVLLVFGPKRLSEVGTGLGEGIRNFKKGLNGGDTENKDTRADGSSSNPGTASKS